MIFYAPPQSPEHGALGDMDQASMAIRVAEPMQRAPPAAKACKVLSSDGERESPTTNLAGVTG
jgi:hypothetical protein